jgi:drug/metabolite transporter (DMT)-like permease
LKFYYIINILTEIISYLLLDEKLSMEGIFGAAVIIICIVTENKIASKEQPSIENVV